MRIRQDDTRVIVRSDVKREMSPAYFKLLADSSREKFFAFVLEAGAENGVEFLNLIPKDSRLFKFQKLRESLHFLREFSDALLKLYLKL